MQRRPVRPRSPAGEENRDRSLYAGAGRGKRAFRIADARQRRRRRPGGRAPVQRAADPVARAPFWAAVEDRGRAHDRPVGPVDVDDHEPTASRRPAQARGAPARPSRPADRARLARSRRRVFDRAEDRTAQFRPGADRLYRRGAPSRPSHLPLSDAGSGDEVHRRRTRAADRLADAQTAPSHRRPRRRRAVSAVELGRRNRRASRQNGRLAIVFDRRGIGARRALQRNAVQRRHLGLRR